MGNRSLDRVVTMIFVFYRTVQAVVELKNKPALWHKAKKVTLQSGQTEVKIEFPLPIVACNLMIEYADFYENIQVYLLFVLLLAFNILKNHSRQVAKLSNALAAALRCRPIQVFAPIAARTCSNVTSVEPSTTTRRIRSCAMPAASASTPSSTSLCRRNLAVPLNLLR